VPVGRKEHGSQWYIPAGERAKKIFPGIDQKIFEKKLMERLPVYIRGREVDAVSDKNIRAVEFLKNQGKRLALLSARLPHEIDHLMEGGYGLGKWFEKVYHAGNLNHPKPDRRAILQALADFDVLPEEAVYMGDLESDGVCANKAGVAFVALLEEKIKSREDFNSVRVDFFAEDLTQIVDYVSLKDKCPLSK